ncbi:MAG: MBL fold metallo-hydrolase [Elusimicrobia bacterium GWD2_63_28]|nr:MAG: MBL fold metallo-hydrolase [Elusimicrobia bacterium GWD2_63_28]
MKVIFLGTNGWYDTGTGNTVCAVIKTKRWDIVLDAGYGIHRLDKYVDGKKPVFILLSHFHIDHIAGLHTLVKFRFKAGLTICGQKGTRRVLKQFVNRPYTVPLDKLPYPVEIVELPSEAEKLPFKVKTLPLVHADPVLGFRLALDGKTVTYITDTGYCANALKLARGANLLITECAHAPGETNPGWPHFNPETAGKLAAEAGAKRLVMTHFSAERYHKPDLRAKALTLARKQFPKTAAAKDGLAIEI